MPVSTSMLIAASEVLAAHDGCDDLAARLARGCLQACGPPGARMLRWVDSIYGRACLGLAEACTLPGIAAHYRWRKRRIARWVGMQVAAGARQLLVLGAGFDALALRMALGNPLLQAFEVDRPESSAAKRHALCRFGMVHPRVALCAADLAQRPPLALLRELPGFDRTTPTVVVAEGLLMYLPPTAVRSLWRGLAGGIDAPVAVVATVMECGADGAPRFRRERPWLRAWLRRRGEPFRWGVARNRLLAALFEAGVEIEELAEPDDSVDADPCPGEWLFRGRLRTD